jgi:hypothetical protein
VREYERAQLDSALRVHDAVEIEVQATERSLAKERSPTRTRDG